MAKKIAIVILIGILAGIAGYMTRDFIEGSGDTATEEQSTDMKTSVSDKNDTADPQNIAECKSLSSDSNIITLDLLKSGLKEVEVNVTRGGEKITLPDFSESQRDAILESVRPYIRPVTGFTYKNAETSIRPFAGEDSENKVTVYVRVGTGEKDLDQFDDIFFEDEYDYLYDFISAAYDDFSFTMTLDPVSFAVQEVKQGYFVGWDVPDSLAACALAMLEQHEDVQTFKELHDNVIMGLLEWIYPGVDNEYESDKIIAVVYSQTPGSYTVSGYEHFVIDPWNSTIKRIKEW